MKNIIALLVIVVAVAVAVQPGFDPKEVVRQVRGAGREASGVERLASDDGEFLIDTSWAIGPAPGGQGSPSVAFDGTNFLVVWVDGRSNYYSDIYGARVSPGGTVLDPEGIGISTGECDRQGPKVSFDGTNFLVVWEDNRSGSTYEIYGARVTPAGTVLDTAGIPISAEATEGPVVSFDGATYFVVWRDYRNNPNISDIYGARVTPQGIVLDPTGIPISTAADDQYSPAVAFDGTNYVVVWTDERSGLGISDIYGARVSQAGTVLDPVGIPISTAARHLQGYPAVAFDGTDFLVVWQDHRGSSYDIYGARVSPAGAVLDAAGIPISTAAAYQEYPAVAFDGTNSLVVWHDERGGDYDIYGARVSQAGTVLDPTGITISTGASAQYHDDAEVAFDGTNYCVVWTDWSTSPSACGIYGARVSPGGTVLDPSGIPISTTVNSLREWSPAVSFDGTNFLVVWTDERGGDDDIYGARVSQAGTVLDPIGMAISIASGTQYSPSVAFDGTNYAVVWMDTRSGSYHIYIARVSPSGTVLDPDGLVVSTAAGGQYWPAVSFNGTNYLVAWTDWRNHSDTSDIYGARVSPGGAVLDPSGIAISTAASSQWSPAVSFDGTNFLVVWDDERSGDEDVYCARVSQAGTVLDPTGIAICTATNYPYSPSVSFDGTNYLVTWTDGRNGPYADIYGARVNQAGTVLDPSGIAICTATSSQHSPSVAFDGADFFVVWTDWRNNPDTTHIYGARVNQAGAVLETFPVVTQQGSQSAPELRRGQGSQLFLVYEGWAGQEQGRWYNTMRIWGKLGPFPGVEERATLDVSRPKPNATIVRGVLFLPVATGHGPRASSTLLDITGRNVMELRPGPNDVSGLSPGVYFVRPEPSAVGREPSAVTKVVTAR